ncbi:hypothetical protein CHUAL_005470 [Chamberlinius hualienensis]
MATCGVRRLFFIITLHLVRCQNLSDLQILDNLLSGYDRRATPTHDSNIPTNVSCELYIRSFGSINPSTMDYQVDLYLHQSWTDPRLNHSSIKSPLDLSDPHLVKSIWKPEIFFPNAKHGEFQYVTVPNVLVRIKPEGEILYMLRLKMVFSCMMDLSRYPLDRQICTMEMASFAKTTRDLRLEWKSAQPVKMYKGLRMPQFEIQDIRPLKCQDTFHIGEYSCIMAEFDLQRSIGYHLVQSYLPTTLIVVISWVSFWMDIEAVPGRVTLGITTLLTVSSKSSGVQPNLPQVSYVKAIDVWLGACTAFVFAALLEFTLVNYLFRKKPPTSTTTSTTHVNNGSTANCESWLPLVMSNKEKSDNVSEDSSTELVNGNHVCHRKSFPAQSSCVPTGSVQYIHPSGHVTIASASVAATSTSGLDHIHKMTARKIDKLSRWYFPISFLVFNLCYWGYYLR